MSATRTGRLASVEHVRLILDELVPDRLEMQPADVVAAHMLAAVARAVFGNADRRDARGGDGELLLAAAFQRDEPEGGRVDRMAAAGEKPVVLVQRRLHALERLGHVAARMVLDGHRAALLADHHVILEEGAGVLRDRVDGAARGAPGRAVGGVGVAHGDDVGMFLVHVGMQDEARAVHGMVALDHAARMVHEDQVRHPHLAEVNAHRVGPVELGPLGVAHGEMAREAIVEALLREGAAGGDQALLAVAPFLCGRGELGQFGKDQPLLFGLVDRDTIAEIEHGASFPSRGSTGEVSRTDGGAGNPPTAITVIADDAKSPRLVR
jgi:hypothetical protein